ncbi:uncharacterized protein LOC121431923 [Lytechinus variegatus]|uniref:uncharacterized protein LOC121431923 n=1 Tax=Lytechinus variegatus TaxID=7654 RepID=UPI001BB1C368|nr:uncharacterized protein LOC121431923 [Lytechinus variegatus]
MSAERKPFRVIMWCVPRSISTALTKCFSWIDNTKIWFEPYCLAFIQDYAMKSMGVTLPAKAADLSPDFVSQLNAATKGTPLENRLKPEVMDLSILLRDGVREQLDSLPDDQSVFVKDMAYGVTNFLDLLPSKESGFKHTFLIRDPERVFPSWRNLLMAQMKRLPLPGQKPIDESTFDMTTDPGFMMPGYTYKCQYDLWRHVKEHFDPEPVVIDIDELVANPKQLLPKYFEACGMPWDESLLSWDASPAVAREWRTLYPMGFGESVTYQRALASTSFQPSRPKLQRSDMTPDAIKAIDETADFYKEMAASRITVD